MVGRSEQVALIDDAVSAASGGRGGLLLVTGEAGIGKTLLGQTAIERATSRGMRAAHGHAVDDPGAPVLWPWRRAARQLPELGQVLATVTATDLDDDAARFAVWEAVADALASAAEPSGLLVVLEDLHWADSLSVALLRHVAFDLPGSRVLVLVTAREDPSTPFVRALPDLLRSSASTPVPLSGLTTADVREWLSSDPVTAGWGVLAADLVRLTDGNPFYIRVLTSQGPPPAAGIHEALTTRHGIRSILVAPLLGLPEDARDTITTAALIAERLSPTLLAAATGRSVPQVSGHLAQGIRTGLLQHGATGLAFVHALVRDAVIAHLDPHERGAVEASIAQAMQATDDELLIGPAAAHWDRAEGSVASARCRDTARLAAARAAATHAHEEAVAFARMSVRHARRLGSGGADLAERLVELAEYEWLAGLIPAALDTCVEAVDLAEAADRADLMAQAALVAQGVGSREVARVVGDLCGRALERVPDDDLEARAGLTALRAVAAAEEAVDTSADALSATALDLARRSGSANAELEAVAARHYVLSYPQAIDERLLLTERAVQLGRSSATAMGFLWGYLWQADIALQKGELGALDAVIEQLGRVVAQRSSPVGRWHEHRLRALRAAVRGAFDEARSEADAGLRIAQRAGDASMIGNYFGLRISLALLRGDPEEIPAAARPMLDQPPPVPLMQAFSAQTLAVLGERDRAVALLDLVRHLPGRMPLGPRWMGTMGQIGLAAAALQDADLAGRCHDLLAPTAHWYFADGGGAPFYHGSNQYTVGVIALGAGAVDAATSHFERAVSADLRIGARPYVALARLGLAQCLQLEPDGTPKGTPSRGQHVRHLATAAADEFRRLDMPGPLAWAERLLAHADPRTDLAQTLTRREFEVAELVAQARTNQQIADQLFLSVRTVESHVRSALAKLDFSTRTELAVWMQAHTDPREG
ncbi:regulatory protein, luxR family [Raineyella antarctica]|uniref:Regulatory protein, luxR family n=1 Tax=Raineyella antarctica TaxID=1577474 RepID=A0A1G6HII9_9ACTN|nr:LuxR family transcriptional regulator [Raineyella antarctica]SDB93745.1 regulatory protein, luxR family [Raineyella antarctica]